MKKIKYIVGFLMVMAILSCNEEDNTLFDQLPRERLQSKIEEYQNILTSVENGWITSYRPDDDFGYFHLWFQFNKDGTVHTLSDIPLVNNRVGGGGIFSPQPGFYKDTTTSYRVSSQNSVDLVFENPMALHYLYSLTIGQQVGKAPSPEFEFYITRATPEEVVLESKTDPGKGGQQKTQMILKKATPEDKENVTKAYNKIEDIIENDLSGKSSASLNYYSLKNFIYFVDLKKRNATLDNNNLIPIKNISKKDLVSIDKNGKDIIYKDEPLCPSDLAGKWKVVSQGTSRLKKAMNNPLKDHEYTVTITDNGKGSYTISDGPAGVYFAFYSFLGVTEEFPCTFIENCGILRGSFPTVFRGDIITWQGQKNEDGTLNVSWSNIFGDRVTSVYKKLPLKK